MVAVNRSNVRASRLAAGALIAGIALTGCSAGQISQSANQQPAVNGTVDNVGNIALRNVFLRAPQTTDYVRPGTDVELIFVAANNSADAPDRLLSVTSDIGTVTLDGDTTVPANGVLKVGNIALRNVFLRAPQTSDYVQPGTEAELIFAAANNSADVDDKLVSITSDVGTVTLTGDAEIPANGLLLVGNPDGHDALGTVEREDEVQAQVTLTEPISNGLTYDFTFTFERAGATTFAVPISAGEVARRDGEPVVGGGGGHGESGGH